MNEEEKKVFEAWLKSFGRCVATRRRKLGLTQKEAAAKIGMNKKFYCDIEYGRRPITTRTLFLLCLRFELPIPYNEAVMFICD
jgi:transcriptional regulator with XRE-family HTH domain